MRQLVLPRSQPVVDLALSPDGQTLAVAHRNYGVVLYDAFDGRVKFVLRGEHWKLSFREDGRWLLATTPHGVLVDLTPSEPRVVPLHFNDSIYRVEFHANDTVVVLGINALREVSLPTQEQIVGFKAEAFVLAERSLRSGRDNLLLFPFGFGPHREAMGCEYDMRARTYAHVVVDSSGNGLSATVATPNGLTTNLYDSRYHHAGGWFVLTTTQEFAVYNWSDVTTLAPPPPREPRRRGLFQTVRETFLGPSAETRHEQRYGHLPILQPRFRLPTDRPAADPLPVAFLPNGEAFLCRGSTSAIELRDTATGQVQRTWQFGRAWPRVLAVAPDGLTAVAAAKGGVTFWDLE